MIVTIIIAYHLFWICLVWFFSAKYYELHKAITKHRDQRGDDRCLLDDIELYSHIGDIKIENYILPPKELMLKNCEKFIDSRCPPIHLYKPLHCPGCTGHDC